MPSSRRSLLLSVRNAYEAIAVSAPTIVDAALGRLTRETCDRRLASFAGHVIENARITVRVHGRENVPRPHENQHENENRNERESRTYLVMSNHVSHYDIPVLYYVLGGRMRMVAKKELFHLPIFGQAIRDAGMIEVDRGNRTRAIASLDKAKAQLASGTPIWIAPEGTRSPTGKLLPFKKGGFVLAFDMGVPILPVTIVGTRDVLPAKGLLSTAGATVDVTIHPLIESSAHADLDRKSALSALVREVRDAIASGFVDRNSSK